MESKNSQQPVESREVRVHSPLQMRNSAAPPVSHVLECQKMQFDQHVERSHDVAALKNILHRSRNTGDRGTSR